MFSGFSDHFPAIQLKRSMDSWDYALNFSGEMLATGLVIIVALANIMAFGVFKDNTELTDNSLAGQLLAEHTQYNPALYAKTNSIKTTILKQQGIISAAFADDGALSSDFNNDISTSGEGGDEIENNAISKPNPDTTRELMAKQITVYETQNGDTLGSLAKKFNVSNDMIKWANNLPNNTIKPGWYLKIPPTSGVLYQATSNDTLPDIAKYFRGNIDTIISYNNLASAEDIEPGQWIICPGCSVPPPPTPVVVPTPAGKPTTTKNQTITNKIILTGGHSFPKGYCTYYVATRMKIAFGGNAKNWLTNAAAAGYTVSKRPAAGTAVVTTDSARYGHVAYVESVQSDGDIVVAEMNYEGFGVISHRTISAGSGTIRGYIYPR